MCSGSSSAQQKIIIFAQSSFAHLEDILTGLVVNSMKHKKKILFNMPLKKEKYKIEIRDYSYSCLLPATMVVIL